MSKFLVLAIVLIACLCLVNSAVVREARILDPETIYKKIIAEYNRRYPGPSHVYPSEVADVIDPNTFRLI